MTATIIDGKASAEKLRVHIAKEVAELKSTRNITPGLTVVRVGEEPASEVYVRNKVKQTAEAGMVSKEHHLPDTVSQQELLALIDSLNTDTSVHGILVQLPLPKQIDANAVIQAVAPEKDVDGFHVINAGKLAVGQESLLPCTPLGCLMLLKDHFGMLAGKHAVIIGRSNIVGKPMAQLLLRESCTVTIVHSRTENIESLVRLGDIVIAAVGKPEMVKANWLKTGAVVIDVGINRVHTPDGKTKLVGDVDFNEAREIAGAITPVPGGVGPMTIACLLQNTLQAAKENS